MGRKGEICWQYLWSMLGGRNVHCDVLGYLKDHHKQIRMFCCVSSTALEEIKTRLPSREPLGYGYRAATPSKFPIHRSECRLPIL